MLSSSEAVLLIGCFVAYSLVIRLLLYALYLMTHWAETWFKD